MRRPLECRRRADGLVLDARRVHGAAQVAELLQMPIAKVKVVADGDRGGFGARFASTWSRWRPVLSKKTGKPVKVLNGPPPPASKRPARRQARSSSEVGADANGKITAAGVSRL